MNAVVSAQLQRQSSLSRIPAHIIDPVKILQMLITPEGLAIVAAGIESSDLVTLPAHGWTGEVCYIGLDCERIAHIKVGSVPMGTLETLSAEDKKPWPIENAERRFQLLDPYKRELERAHAELMQEFEQNIQESVEAAPDVEQGKKAKLQKEYKKLHAEYNRTFNNYRNYDLTVIATAERLQNGDYSDKPSFAELMKDYCRKNAAAPKAP